MKVVTEALAAGRGHLSQSIHSVRHQAYSTGASLSRHFSANTGSARGFSTTGICDKQTALLSSGLNEIADDMKRHRALQHPLFQYLPHIATSSGLTPRQFELYRTNFFCRTKETIPSVARVIIAAANNQDTKTLASAGRNIFEETGEGNHSLAHSHLLEHSHNIHGRTVFGLGGFRLRESSGSQLLVPACHDFIAEQRALYTDPSYATVLGTGFAHEFAADPMLSGFFKGFFLPYKGYYAGDTFSQVSKYFDVHLGGVEERHAQDAREALMRACKIVDDLRAVKKGAFGFLDIQATLWDGLLVAIEKAHNKEEAITPRLEFEKPKGAVQSLATTSSKGRATLTPL
jgi:hypothetical protein